MDEDDEDLGPSGTLVIEPDQRSDGLVPRREGSDSGRLIPVPVVKRHPSERPIPPAPMFQLVSRDIPRPKAEPAPRPPKPIDLTSNQTQQMDVQPPRAPHELDWGEEPRTQVKPEEDEIQTRLKEPPPTQGHLSFPISIPYEMPESGPYSAPPSGPQHGPFSGAQQPPPSGPHPMPPSAQHEMPHSEHQQHQQHQPLSMQSASLEGLLPGGPLRPGTGSAPDLGYPRPPAPPQVIRGWVLLAFGGALGLVFSIAAVVIALHRGPEAAPSTSTVLSTTAQAPGPSPPVASQRAPTPIASANPSLSETPSASGSAVASASATPSASAVSPADPSMPEADRKAVAALEKLRDGIKKCVKETIHVLPGTSRPVPDAMSWFKHGPYKSMKRDWISPFYSCTGFKLEEPMPFMIQWQIDKANVRGTGVAWIVDNKGFVARVYGFTGKLTGKEVEFGPIGPLDVKYKIKH